MARRSVTVRIDAEGRDKGKAFLLTEMPATRAEKWAIKALLAISRSGADLPDGFDSLGMAGLARVGIGALLKLPFEDAEPLLDEMFACVQAIPDPTNASVIRSLIEDDIEEVSTRIKLRFELLKLHTGFSAPGA